MFEEIAPLTPSDFFAIQVDCHLLKEKMLSRKALLPDLSCFYENASFADIYLGWNTEGMIFRAQIDVPFDQPVFPDFQSGDSIELFFDTRDVKTTGYTTRFCHHFYILPSLPEGSEESVLAAEVTRFRTEDVHELCDPAKLSVLISKEKRKKVIDLFIPAECLYGFDPLQFGRIGFTYRINRLGGQKQYFSSSSSDFAIEQQPSTWASLKFVE